MNLNTLLSPMLSTWLKRSTTQIPAFNEVKPDGAANNYNRYTNDLAELEERSNVIADKTVLFKDTVNYCGFDLTQRDLLLLSAINHILITTEKKEMKILDYGGACGEHYLAIRKFLPAHLSVRWVVIDRPDMVKIAVSRNLSSEELVFISDLEKIKGVDLIFSSSILQFEANPYHTLKKLLELKARFILFDQVCLNLNNSDSVGVSQSLLSEHGPGPLPDYYRDKPLKLPYTLLAFNRFMSLVTDSYELVYRAGENKTNRFKPDQLSVTRSLFLERKTLV